MKKTNLQFNELITAMREAIGTDFYRKSDYPPRDTMIDIATLWKDSEGCTAELTRYWALREYGTLLQDGSDFSSVHVTITEVYKIQCASDSTWSIEKL